MNKYRGIQLEQALPVPLKPKPTKGLLDKGIVLFRSPQDIDLDQSPDLGCVRVFEAGLRQDFELTELSTSTPLRILSLGEHKFVISGTELFERIFRVYRKANTFIRIESWNLTTWDTEFDADDWIVEDVLLSFRSYFATAFFADGERVLEWIQTASLNAQSDEFTSGNSLTAVDDTVDAVLNPAVAYLGNYAVHYDLSLTGPCKSGSSVTISIEDDDGTQLVKVVHPIPANTDTNRQYDLVHEVASVTVNAELSDNMTLKIKDITVVAVQRLNPMSFSAPLPQWSSIKARAREAIDDEYTFFDWDIEYIGNDPFNEPGTFVEFYYDTGAGWVLWYNATSYKEAEGDERVLIQAGLGTGDKFGIHIKSADQSIYVISGSPNVVYDEGFGEEVAVHGFNKATDSDASEGIIYQDEGTPVNEVREVDKDPSVARSVTGATATSGGTKTITDTGAGWGVNAFATEWVQITGGTGLGQIRRIVSNTSEILTVGEDWTNQPDNTSVFDIYPPVLLQARYLGIFADRVLALQADGDPQKIDWSVNGDGGDYVGNGSGSSILASFSDDPIDELIAFEPLSSNVGLLFRRRSIMRVTRTGVAANALAFFNWLDNFGTESPFSVTPVPGGIIFLGHDKQVYYITEQGPNPISQFIQEELEATIGDLSVVEGQYDLSTQNYILAVPGLSGSNTSVSWSFDFGRMISESVFAWQKREETMNRLAIVGGREIIFAGSDNIVRQYDRDTPCTNAYWTSPMLNRENIDNEYSLLQVIVRYQAAAATTLVIEASDDGGKTWKAGYKTSITLTGNPPLFISVGGVKRAVQGFNITGHDLRFRITWPSDAFVTIRNWRADLVERGDLGSE